MKPQSTISLPGSGSGWPARLLAGLLAWNAAVAHAGTGGPALPAETAARARPAPHESGALITLEQDDSGAKSFQARLELARRSRLESNEPLAERILLSLMDSSAAPELKRDALLELAQMAYDSSDLPKSQRLLAQFVRLYPEDVSVPEVLLRQGIIYRQMGAPLMAVSKFYGVMNSSLKYKADRLDYYQRLVLQSQTEIAATHYSQGNYEEAANLYRRLLKLENAAAQRPQFLLQLIRCLNQQTSVGEMVAHARQFLTSFPQSEFSPEVRFLLAGGLKTLGHNQEAMREVLQMLQAQQDKGAGKLSDWVYWQQRIGNELANQFFLDGDLPSALQVYLALASLNSAPAWQLPVQYQAALIYEKLEQPLKAAGLYAEILSREKEVSDSPGNASLQLLLEMARWRVDHLKWRDQTAQLIRQYRVNSNAPAPMESLTGE